jgi:tetratricopeptide (TPR) repeat protein
MRCRGFAPFALAALLAGSVSAEEPVPSEPPAEYHEATRLAAQGQWAEAAERFRAALAIRETAAGRFNLGQAERNLGRFASAQREFERARELAEREGADDVRALAAEALGALAARTPKLVIELPPEVARASARVDGEPAVTGRAIALDPGRHAVSVEAPGKPPFARTVSLREAQTLRLVVTFAEPEPGPAPVRRRAPAPRAAPAASGPPIGAVLLAGVGAAAFTTAALLHVRRNDKLEEASRDCQRSGDGFVCPSSLESDTQHRDLIESADRAELARDVLIGVGAGAWTAGALWWLLDAGSGERPVAGALGPVPGGAAARVRVVF